MTPIGLLLKEVLVLIYNPCLASSGQNEHYRAIMLYRQRHFPVFVRNVFVNILDSFVFSYHVEVITCLTMELFLFKD